LKETVSAHNIATPYIPKYRQADILKPYKLPPMLTAELLALPIHVGSKATLDTHDIIAVVTGSRALPADL
jgi:hypothetical protein